MTSDTKNTLNGEITKRNVTPKEGNLDVDLSLVNDSILHTSSSTAQLCPSYDYNDNKIGLGIDNQGFEAINLDNRKRNASIEQVAVAKKHKWYKSLSGMCLIMLSALFFSLTTVIVKYVKDVEPGQMAFVRFSGILIFTIPLLMDSSRNPFGPKESRHWLILRGMAGATSIFFRYSALHYMSISNATVIVLSMPIFVFIFARIFLKESFGWFHVIALLVTLIGITFTSKLAIIFTQTQDAINDSGIDSKKELIGLAFSLGATLVGAAAYVLVRKIKDIKHSIILFNFSWVAVTETSIITLCMNDFKMPNNMQAINSNAWLLCLLAVFSFYGQLLLTKALQAEEAGLVAITRASSEVIYAFIFQITIFADMPDKWSYIGAALVMLSVVMTSFRKWVLSLPKDSTIRRKFNFIAK